MNILVMSHYDNYNYLGIYDENKCFIVDPGNADVVLATLRKHHLVPTHILITHHHCDHTGGIKKILAEFDCLVIGPDDPRISEIQQPVEDNDIIELGLYEIRVITVPGHTCQCTNYYVEPTDEETPGLLFSGDTLFVCGCGRILESPTTMYDSLQKLAELPDNTLLYCGHNYTEENYRFALTVEPDNPIVKDKLARLKPGDITVPSTIAVEKQTNPFLRTDNPTIRETLNMPNAENSHVFGELRKRKDLFG